MNTWRRMVSAGACVALASCAITPQQFHANRESYSAEQLCNIWRTHDDEIAAAAEREAHRRGMDVERCRAILAESDKRNQAAAAGALLALVLIGAAAKGGGGAAPAAVAPVHVDTEWAWDQFFNEHNELVWGCRGVQTGQFHPLVRCQYLVKIDSRWPGTRLY